MQGEHITILNNIFSEESEFLTTVSEGVSGSQIITLRPTYNEWRAQAVFFSGDAGTLSTGNTYL